MNNNEFFKAVTVGTIETRKLLKLGHSIVVCLPLGWLSWKGLKQGDKVRIRTNRKLTIETEPMPKGTNEAEDTKNKAT